MRTVLSLQFRILYLDVKGYLSKQMHDRDILVNRHFRMVSRVLAKTLHHVITLIWATQRDRVILYKSRSRRSLYCRVQKSYDRKGSPRIHRPRLFPDSQEKIANVDYVSVEFYVNLLRKAIKHVNKEDAGWHPFDLVWATEKPLLLIA